MKRFMGLKIPHLKVIGILFTLLLSITPLKAQKSNFILVKNRMINLDTLDMQVNNMIKDMGVPGLSFAIINNNEVVYYQTYGYKQIGEKKKINKRTIFEAASFTKNYLVFVVYKLVDEGKLDLDKPMYQYLKNKKLEHDPRYKLITPRMVLSHSSGIENWKRFNDPDTLEILCNPGEKFVYSGEGYQYLAKIVDSIINKPYKEYIEEMILNPLKLRRTFTAYKPNKKKPSNYAIGHDASGNNIAKWKNTSSIPAGGNHTTAKDYANLIISFFNNSYISNNRIQDMLEPIVRLYPDNPFYYYGPGFQVIYSSNDTIISHGGVNNGFKNDMYYSVKSKCGIVFMSNGDRGNLMANELNKMTINLNLNPVFESYPFAQYPSNANMLLNIYKKEGADMMLKRLNDLRNEEQLDAKTLAELAFLFMDKNVEIAKKFSEECIELFPEFSASYYFLGQIYLGQKNYQLAYENLNICKELSFNLVPIDYDIAKCKKELSIK